MMHKIFGDPKDPLWKELAEMAVKKAVSTFVGESVKAVVDIWKSRHLKEMEVEFKERAKARKAEAGDTDDKPQKPDNSDGTDDSDGPEEDGGPEEDDSDTPDDRD